MRVAITIPAYNEEKNIGSVVRGIREVMDQTSYNYKILVVNDGSTDKTAEIAQQAGAIVYSHPRNYGLAEAFKTEIEKCLEIGAEVIVHTDADGQYLARDIPRLLDEINKGYDLVLGSRFRGRIENMPLTKKLGNRAFSYVISNIIKKKVSDCQTGFRAFRREVAERIPITSTYTYTQEQIIRAVKNKFKIKEIPIFFAKRGKKTRSRLMRGPLHYATSAGINLIRVYRDYEPIRFFGIFGLGIMAIGFLIGIELLIRSIRLGFPSGFWDLHTPTLILIAIFAIAGLQLIFFGLLADMRKTA